MTRTERRKQNFEKLKQKEALKIKRMVTIDTILQNCDECEFCKKIILFENKQKWICLNKSRKDIQIFEKNKKIGFYPYGEISGVCPNLALMMFDDESK